MIMTMTMVYLCIFLQEEEKSIAFLSSNYDDLTGKLSKLHSDYGNLSQECADLRFQCFALANEYSQLKQNVNDMEQYLCSIYIQT